MKPRSMAVGVVLFWLHPLFPLSATLAAEPADCRIVHDGTRVELQSPTFIYHLDMNSGLRAVAWENRLTGKKISLGDGSELEVDLGEPSGTPLTPRWQASSVLSIPATGVIGAFS